MLTDATLFELSRLRLEAARERAALVATFGELPAPRPLFCFRRRVVKPLAGPVEIRRDANDKARLRRRLVELAATQRKAS